MSFKGNFDASVKKKNRGSGSGGVFIDEGNIIASSCGSLLTILPQNRLSHALSEMVS